MSRKTISPAEPRVQGEERVRNALLAAPFPVILHAEDGQIVLVSEVWTELTGYSREEIPTIEAWLEKAYPERQRPEVRRAIARLYGIENRVKEGEFTITTKNGLKRIWDFNSAALGALPDGRRLVVTMANDVTDRRQVEEALRASEQRFRALVKNIPGVVFRCRLDEHRTMEYVSAFAKELCGYPASDFVGNKVRDFASIIHPEDWHTVRRTVREGIEKTGSYDVEYRLLNAAGHTRWVFERGQKAGVTGGQAQLLDGVILDVTEAKRNQQAVARRGGWAEDLQRAGQTLSACHTVEAVMEAAAKAPVEHLGLRIAWITTFDGEGRPQLAAVSSEAGAACVENTDCAVFVRRTGKKAVVADVRERSSSACCTERSSVEDFGSCATFPVLVDGKCAATLSVVGTDSGPEATVVNAASLLEVFCSQVGAVWSRCVAERSIEAARAAAVLANQAKSEFLANMSHELRTPLNSIIGFSEILGERAFGELNQKQKKHVDNILSSGRHLLALINDILDLSKVEAGRMELSPEPLKLRSALETGLTMIRERALHHRLSLTLEVAPELSDLVVWADERKLKQILFNLLSNAAKFTPDGGAIGVKAVRESSMAVVAVRDTGIGIRPEDQARIFREFEQIDSSYAKQQQGTGLGLALTRRLVELHGGSIWVESEGEGRGSTFSFRLPLNPESGASERHLGPAKGGRGGETVLVIADNRRSQEELKRYLDSQGYSVVRAFDGVDGIGMARRLQPFAIVLDLHLSGTDGLEVLSRLKALPGTADIPVIVVSVADDGEIAFGLGALEFLVEPVDEVALRAALQRARRLVRKAAARALVVDDDPATVELVVEILQTMGYTALKAYKGQHALDLALREPPDLAILDLFMPEVSGFEVLRELRAHPVTRDIPVIVYTAHDPQGKDRRWLQENAAKIVIKSGKEALVEELKKLEALKAAVGKASPGS